MSIPSTCRQPRVREGEAGRPLLPFLAATVDLFAHCRRRRIRIAPALRSYRSRLAFWSWCGAIFGVLALLGVWSAGGPRPPSLASVHWPTGGLIGLAVLAGLGWLVARDRLLPRRPIRAEEELAGHAAALAREPLARGDEFAIRDELAVRITS